MGSQETEVGFIVLPDNALRDEQKIRNQIIADYNGNPDDIESIINSITKNNQFYIDYGISVDTKKDIREASIGLGAVVTFLGLYLGIIFLISCAAILALKELSESSDNVEKFKMLRRIGVDEAMINKALFRQIGIFFGVPLVLAIIHSIFGIQFAITIMSGLASKKDLLPSAIATVIIIGIIYGIYFLATYLGSKNIIKEDE